MGLTKVIVTQSDLPFISQMVFPIGVIDDFADLLVLRRRKRRLLVYDVGLISCFEQFAVCTHGIDC